MFDLVTGSRSLPFAGLVASLLLSGCAVAPYATVDAQARTRIASTESIASIAQGEINADIVVSNAAAAMGGGLIVALIDAGINNSRAKDAEAMVRGLRDQLVEVNFDQEFRAALDQSLRQVPWLNATPTVIEKTAPSTPSYENLVARSRASAQLLVGLDYAMSANFSQLEIRSNTYLFPTSADLRAATGKQADVRQENAIYRNFLTYSAPLASPGASPEENLAIWQQNPVMLKTALREGIQGVASALAVDLQSVAPAETPLPAQDIVVNGTSRKVASATPLGNATLLRMPIGTLELVATPFAPGVARPTAQRSYIAAPVPVTPAPATYQPVPAPVYAPPAQPPAATAPQGSSPSPAPPSSIPTLPRPAIAGQVR